jgi:hypothetical protein
LQSIAIFTLFRCIIAGLVIFKAGRLIFFTWRSKIDFPFGRFGFEMKMGVLCKCRVQLLVFEVEGMGSKGGVETAASKVSMVSGRQREAFNRFCVFLVVKNCYLFSILMGRGLRPDLLKSSARRFIQVSQ